MSNHRIGATLIAWALLVGALLASDSQPHALLLGGIVGVCAAIGFSALDLVRAGGSIRWATAPRPEPNDVSTEFIDGLVAEIRGGRRRPSAELRNTLLDLVDQRLQDHHGIDTRRDQTTASSLLSPRLRVLFDQPRVRLSSTADLDALLSDIEEI